MNGKTPLHQKVLEGRMQSFQAGRPGGVSSGSASGQLFQGVKVVDKDYLEKKMCQLGMGKRNRFCKEDVPSEC